MTNKSVPDNGFKSQSLNSAQRLCKLPFSTVFHSKLYVGYVKRKKYHLVKSKSVTVQISGHCVVFQILNSHSEFNHWQRRVIFVPLTVVSDCSDLSGES